MELKMGILHDLSGFFDIDAQKIWAGKVSLIVKNKSYSFISSKPLYLIDKEFAYGIIRLKAPKKVLIDTLKRFEFRHQISDDERIRRWPYSREFFIYDFYLEKFNKPKKIEKNNEAKVFVSSVRIMSNGKIKITEEQIQNIFKLTYKNLTRREIAEKVGINPATVWRYQKQFDLI